MFIILYLSLCHELWVNWLRIKAHGHHDQSSSRRSAVYALELLRPGFCICLVSRQRKFSLSLSLWSRVCVCVFLSFQKYCLWCSVMLSDVDWCWLLTDGLCWLYWLVFVDLIVKTQALSGQSGPFFFTKPRRTCLNIWCAYIYIYMYIYIYILYTSTLMAYYDPFALSKWPHVGACLIFVALTFSKNGWEYQHSLVE